MTFLVVSGGLVAMWAIWHYTARDALSVVVGQLTTEIANRARTQLVSIMTVPVLLNAYNRG
jgi:hypothetical protein